jgi:hypothetical protein
MKRTITRLFDNRADAVAAVSRLEAMGVPHHDLSIVAHNRGTVAGEERSFDAKDGHSDTAEGAGKGAGTGAAIGGVGGLLAGLGLLAIPGVGPVVAAGWLASTLVGAAGGAVVGGAAGGLLGALKDAGVSDEDANVYAEGVRRGGALVSAKVDEADATRIQAVLDEARGIDATTRRGDYAKDGWTRFDETAAPYDAGTGEPYPAGGSTYR